MAEYSEEEELAELRRRRLQQIQTAPGAGPASHPAYAQAQQAEMDRRESERQELLRRVLTPEARERLGRIRLAKPEVAQSIEQQILGLAASGRLQRVVDDAMLRSLLERLMPDKREITITRR
ncbi:MAG: DNA-binding protein [Thermoplasmata archaeon]